MKRLRDTEPDSARSARARQLVESVDPLDDDPIRMQRVRRAISAAERGGATAAAERAGAIGRAGRRWPVLGLAAALGLFGASAFAAVRFVEAWRAEQASDVAADAPEAPTSKGAPRAARNAAATEAAPEADTDWLEPMQPSTDDARAHEKPRRAPARPEREPAAADDATDSPHSALVHEALQALRHQHQPARAERLLAEYATRAPTGPLAEEALSLRIEAAEALGDPRARTLATRYLERYPNGRYTHVARRALAPR